MPILHRDLKPANLLVTRHLQVKIADFGLSMQRDSSLEEGGVGAVELNGGTVAYSAPEVLLGKACDEKVDVFSFGVCVWEIYCRRRPWDGVHEARVTQIVGMEDKRLDVPEDCQSRCEVVLPLIERCWMLVAADRPSFSDLLDSVKSIAFVDIEQAS